MTIVSADHENYDAAPGWRRRSPTKWRTCEKCQAVFDRAASLHLGSRVFFPCCANVDVSVFPGELTAARTILILSVIFLLIYILSWWWMVFALKQAKDDVSCSLKDLGRALKISTVDVSHQLLGKGNR